MQNLTVGMKELGEMIRKEVERVIIEQGHRLTGEVFTDVENIVKSMSDIYLLEGHYRDYSVYLHHGVKASRIPYSPGSGRKTSKYIEALKQYARHRGMTDPDRAAFAIAHKQKKEGMPTRGSYAYSKTGERLRFLDFALDNERVDKKVEQILFDAISVEIDNLLSRQQRIAIQRRAA